MPEILPIGGGKGGVGKSFVTANLGALIAKRNQRVILLDLDLGASNLHTFLNIKSPKTGLHTFLNKQNDRLERSAVPTHIPNLFLISSMNCSMEIANLFHAQKIKLINAIKKLPYEYILLDLGAGTSFNTLDFFLTSEKGLFVCTPDPTSIENSFRFIKSVYLRKLKQVIKSNNFNKVVKDAISESGNDLLTSTQIIDLVLKYDPGREIFLREKIGRFQFKFILNQFRKNSDSTLGQKIEMVCNRHFYSTFEFVGHINFDERVSDAIIGKTIYALEYPDSAGAEEIKGITDRLMEIYQGNKWMSKVS
jgi:flagellar biosynthesis protein FlhG